MKDGKEKGPEEPEGEVEDEPDDDDGEEPGGRGRGVAVLGGVRAEARAVGWRGGIEVNIAAVAVKVGLLGRGGGVGTAGFQRVSF